MIRATTCLVRAARFLPILAVLLSLFLPSESAAFIRRDLSPDTSFLAAETCRNVPVAYKDPTGKENEIVATVGGVTVGRWPSASDYATYNVRINGGGVLDPGAFEVYAGNAGADVVAAVEINKQAAALLVPRPDLTYRLGQQQAGIAFDPAKSGLEKSLGSLGLVSASILTVGEFIPVVNVGVRPISRVLGRVALTEAERGVEKAVARAEVAAARNLAEDAARSRVQAYEVGTANALKARSVVGDALDIHHVGQATPLEQVVPGYSRATGPAIALPEVEHGLIPTVSGTTTMSARDVLANDIRNLRNLTEAPNSSLQELIRLNKEMYPGAYAK